MRILTLKETAAYLQLSLMTCYRMAKTGELPVFKVGGRWRTSQEQLDKMIQKALGDLEQHGMFDSSPEKEKSSKKTSSSEDSATSTKSSRSSTSSKSTTTKRSRKASGRR